MRSFFRAGEQTSSLIGGGPETITILALTLSGAMTAFFEWSTFVVVSQFIISIFVALVFSIYYRSFKKFNSSENSVLKYFFFYGLVVFFRSVIVAKSYDQWSYLVNVFAPFLMAPAFAVFGARLNSLIKLLKALLFVSLPLWLAFLFKGGSPDRTINLMALHYAAPVFLFVILIPFLRFRWKIFSITLSILVVTFDLQDRSMFLFFLVSYLILVVGLVIRGINYRIQNRILGSIRAVFLFGPILCLVLGLFGNFNLFSYLDGVGDNRFFALGGDANRDLTTDSRSVIYSDAYSELSDSNNWLFGSTAVVRQETGLALSIKDYKYGRLGGSESGFLSLLTFGGLGYAGLMFFIFYKASKVAIFSSHNLTVKLIGVFVSFEWLYSFIVLPIGMHFGWILVFLTVGISFNREVRQMSDFEMAKYLKGIYISRRSSLPW